MKRYNLINNSLGWLCFVVAAVTYLLTLEPTASFWDCPEFISQGYKLEVGHPPGNPIFMLTARFFVTLFGGGAQTAAVAVNTMSALLSAGTILLLFWTITHLVRRLTVRDDAREISLAKMIIIMGAGICGALAYTWSDTFWFSAVEGEVYAFSSFCTALVFWLILKWENRMDRPHSDRYIVLIAYVIGISIAVHLLNLLCIPAIVLVFYYRKFKNTNVRGSLLALAISAAIVGLILYGLVPGFISVAQEFELFFVNVVGLSYNSGVLAYAVILVAVFAWTLYELYVQRNALLIKIGVLLSLVLSGMPFIGHSWLIPTVLILAMVIYLFGFCDKVPTRVFNIVILSVFVIFIGYSSYALLLIRASANPPMNQNAPDNVFALASYLNREQYGDRPLYYGQTFAEEIQWREEAVQDPETGQTVNVVYAEVDESGLPTLKTVDGIVRKDGRAVDTGEDVYTKVVKTSPDQPDRYVKEQHNTNIKYADDQSMWLPRMYSTAAQHVPSYKSWTNYEISDFADIPVSKRREWAQSGYVTRAELIPYLHSLKRVNLGDETKDVFMPGFGTNLQYFVNYQLNHMYWRYFMWNFAGRQNDYAGNGEPHLGNWISGIPFIDNARLGDQSLLPPDYGSENAGHNVFYMLPLLLGIFGLLWQSLKRHPYYPARGIEQFWVVFFLFFMTGIAIVLYLNQTPGQPRERDYAFAGSFYAFAIWLGMGVPAIAAFLRMIYAKIKHVSDMTADEQDASAPSSDGKQVGTVPTKVVLTAAVVAAVIGLIVPLQMVSQTWDDHDRSGRYTARDFGMNYLNSLDDDAIIFVNGDNDTFPLWYAQEVEGCRTDVKVVNLSYLSTAWYANQIAQASYDAKGVPMFANPEDYAYDKLTFINIPAEKIYAILAEDALSENPVYIPLLGELPGAETHYKYARLAQEAADMPPVTISEAMKEFYAKTNPAHDVITKIWEVPYSFTRTKVLVPLDEANMIEKYGDMGDVQYIGEKPYMLLGSNELSAFSGGLTEWLRFDIIAKSAKDGFKRPVYFASTVGPSYYLGLSDNFANQGMAYKVTPFTSGATKKTVAQAYMNIVGKFRWGGIDSKDKKPYLDETVRNMVSSTRLAMIDAADEMMAFSNEPAPADVRAMAKSKGLAVPATYADMAANILEYMQEKLPADVAPYESGMDVRLAQAYSELALLTGKEAYFKRARQIAGDLVTHYAPLMKYVAALPGDMSSRLGHSTQYDTRYNLASAVGMLNMLDLGEKIMAGSEDSDFPKDAQLATIINMLRNRYSVQMFIEMFLINDPQRLEQLEDRFGQEFAMVRVLCDYYGIDPAKVTNEVTKKIGLSVNQWLKLTTI